MRLPSLGMIWTKSKPSNLFFHLGIPSRVASFLALHYYTYPICLIESLIGKKAETRQACTAATAMWHNLTGGGEPRKY